MKSKLDIGWYVVVIKKSFINFLKERGQTVLTIDWYAASNNEINCSALKEVFIIEENDNKNR